MEEVFINFVGQQIFHYLRHKTRCDFNYIKVIILGWLFWKWMALVWGEQGNSAHGRWVGDGSFNLYCTPCTCSLPLGENGKTMKAFFSANNTLGWMIHNKGIMDKVTRPVLIAFCTRKSKLANDISLVWPLCFLPKQCTSQRLQEFHSVFANYKSSSPSPSSPCHQCRVSCLSEVSGSGHCWVGCRFKLLPRNVNNQLRATISHRTGVKNT